jgi:hypothetical protein
VPQFPEVMQNLPRDQLYHFPVARSGAIAITPYNRARNRFPLAGKSTRNSVERTVPHETSPTARLVAVKRQALPIDFLPLLSPNSAFPNQREVSGDSNTTLEN